MKHLKRLILMMQFLTAIPIKLNLNVSNEDFGKGLVFAPVVGMLLGGVLAGSFYILNLLFPVGIAAVLIIIIYIALTGGLHIDGLGDTFDGLFSNRSRERMLEIMRDSRVGTNAVIAIVCVILLNTALLAGMDAAVLPKVLLLLPVAGRIGSLIGAGISVYARSGEGLGKSFIEFCGIKEIFKGLPLYLLFYFLVSGWVGLALSLIPVLTSVILTRMFSGKIGGATGDILGAVCELNQTIFLLFCYVIYGLR